MPITSAITNIQFIDIVDFVTEVMSAEDSRPSRKFIKNLANQGLYKLSQLSGGISRTWTNGVNMDLAANVVPIPADVAKITSVWWDDQELTLADDGTLNWLEGYWRGLSGTPTRYVRNGNHLMLDVTPGGVSDGMLTIHGEGLIPNFSDVALATNPLDYLSANAQLLPAYYVLANLPAKNDQIQLARKQEYQSKWNDEFAQFAASSMKRDFADYEAS